ncbi:hypothetical protein [Nitrosopumilus sp. S4]
MGDDWRGWKNGKYDNRYNGIRRRSKKKNTKGYVITLIGVITIIGVILVNSNYDVKINNQKIEEYIPIEKIEKTFNEMYEKIPVESINNKFDEISNSIPITIERKSETHENKLKDCSVYKKNYLDANKNLRTTEDNMAAMIGDALTSVEKTKACETYNEKIYQEFGVLGHCKPPPLTSVKLDNSDGELTMSYKERFIKYCGQEEWDYINKK